MSSAAVVIGALRVKGIILEAEKQTIKTVLLLYAENCYINLNDHSYS